MQLTPGRRTIQLSHDQSHSTRSEARPRPAQLISFSLGLMRTRRVLLGTAIFAMLALFVLAALPIVRARQFFSRNGARELSIQGFLPPHGGERGIHFYDTRAGELRIRSLTVDFRVVAWQFDLVEPYFYRERPNHAMELTTSRRTTLFSVTTSLSPAAARVPARGSSSCSR